MTLIEIMIVVALIAMIAGSVAVVATSQAQKARLMHAATNARSIRVAAQGATAMQLTDECPTVESLRASRLLDKGANPIDPWGQPYTIACADDDMTVTSPGPDKRLGSEDDIHVP